ncbi:glycosyltransferase [Pelagicoccus sp. SDUM812005]|uniref:glycosyltransferase n=1 Tax=Pelagicoccus sp. SDUM812005 TaxID=3041257 RepID=UPI0028108389|nr:glycosyltransferase [Pelagicoccus sp. SDUM812005]MDQ8181321.1 glycosyltransferase [Pelagicoccus sp. SDUM812005]
MDPLVSIVIPVHNHVGYLLTCLRSIERTANRTSYEIIVIDDHSDARNAHELDQIEGIRLIRNYENLGFLRSCNRAALNARGQFIVFLNSDTEVTDHWLDELLDTFHRFDKVGIVGSKLIYPDGTLQECGGIIWSNGTGCNYGRGEDRNNQEYGYTREVDYVSGASLLIERELFVECGLFDYRFAPAYYEDTDLAFKVRELGRKVLVEPKSIVIHHEGLSNGTDENAGVKRYQEVNRKVFVEKWKKVLNAEHLAPGADFIRARDRSLSKKRILVIDHYVPPFDKDAGSRCIYLYLQLLKELDLSVTFLPNNFYQAEPYTSELERLGIEVIYGKRHRENIDSWAQIHFPTYDYILLSRPNIAVQHLDRIKRYSHAKTLFFGHDIHHLRLQRERDLTGNVELAESIAVAKSEEEKVWSFCDTLLYPSQEEVAYVKERCGQKSVVEVPIYFYDAVEATPNDFADRKGILFVGNFNHPPNIDGLRWFFSDVYPLLRDNEIAIPLSIVGSSIPDEVLSYASDSVSIFPELTDEELAGRYRKSRIAIAPLRFGAGVKGKVLESLFYQLPIVTTSYGAQGIPNLEEAASIEDTAAGFAQSCLSLYLNERKWNDTRKSAASVLLGKFSRSNAKQILLQLLD